jgi:hypothetical protein
MDLDQFLELRQVTAALFGAIMALGGQALARRLLTARTAKRLCMAFWEELQAVNFYEGGGVPNFAGFSSQTFDSLFQELAHSLPETLTRDLMRYHWRMKYMEEMKPVIGHAQPVFWAAAKQLHAQLSVRLDHFANRWTGAVFVRSGETVPHKLLPSTAKQDAG